MWKMNYSCDRYVRQVPKNGTYFNRFEMMEAMVNRTTVVVGGVRGKILGIALEDGSGHNFNVTVIDSDNESYTIYVKG